MPVVDAPPFSVIDLKGYLLRILIGLDPVDSITPRLQAFAAQTLTGCLHNLDGVVRLAVEGQNLDLLNRVLDEPMFCPTETSRSPRRGEQPDRMRRLYGSNLFNGGLHAAVVDPTRQGLQSSSVAWLWSDWERTRQQQGGTPVTAGGPAIPQPTKEIRDAATFWSRNMQEALRVPYQEYRAHREVNLVGLAVMMGWPEGVQALLDHGVQPYARPSTETQDGSARTFISPVVLAGHYHEVECLRRLVQHPSFEVHGRRASYGHDETTWAKLKEKPTLAPWRNARRHGGLEIEFVLESAAAMDDPAIRTAMRGIVNGLNRSWLRKLNDPTTGLSPAGQRTLEALVLETLVCEQPADAPRVRSRL